MKPRNGKRPRKAVAEKHRFMVPWTRSKERNQARPKDPVELFEKALDAIAPLV